MEKRVAAHEVKKKLNLLPRREGLVAASLMLKATTELFF
jgi:hypothetical protein